ncbi:uncharacterized protein LOC141717854 isoform X1 [Apium graveolens]|uniref:uncharacterized protein LOC141717854 isoform X1 n=1 Tax=Apium graveolens TaxID=4045 RepID=UPI003D78FAE6
MCSTISKTCKVLPKVIKKVKQAATLVDLQDDISSIWGWLRLDGSKRQLCTSREEEKQIPNSGKTLAQSKREQCWRYDPTIKYEAVRRFAVPRYAYDSSDWSDSSDCEYENVYMAGKEAQTEKDNLLAVTKKEQVAGTEEEQLFYHDPSIKYKPLSRYIVPKFAFSDTSSTDWSESTDSESDTELMAEEATRGQKEKIRDDTRVERLFCNDLAKSPSTDFQSVAEDLTKSSSANLQSKSSV